METGETTTYMLWVGRGAIAIEALAVALIVVVILTATISWLGGALRLRAFTLEEYRRYRSRLGRALLLGLEILVAADIVRTVALEPTILKVAALGLLVVVRTFLSWSIVVEVEGRWPWQPRPEPGSQEKSI